VQLDERRLSGEAAETMVLRLAAGKATLADSAASRIVVAADTAVVAGAEIYGKPRDRDEGLAMLASLSGRTHRVLTAVAVLSGGDIQTALSTTEVRFREILPDEALAYWQSGEPCDKAGAYAIQGLGGIFVESISGSYSAVVGLPVFETARLLSTAGLDLVFGAHRKP
jgi:septum formation protein